MSEREITSKTMSYLLRHKLSKFKTTQDGYVSVEELIAEIGFIKKIGKNITKEMIEEVVINDVKSRYSTKSISGVDYIRANQGHSIASGKLINQEELLEKVKIPISCFHGTYEKNKASILKSGLNRMKRMHIHLAVPGGISGMRQNSNLKIWIDMEKAMADGIIFYKSANGVILTSGNDEGILEPKYFLSVESI